MSPPVVLGSECSDRPSASALRDARAEAEMSSGRHGRVLWGWLGFGRGGSGTRGARSALVSRLVSLRRGRVVGAIGLAHDDGEIYPVAGHLAEREVTVSVVRGACRVERAG